MYMYKWSPEYAMQCYRLDPVVMYNFPLIQTFLSLFLHAVGASSDVSKLPAAQPWKLRHGAIGPRLPSKRRH